MKTRNRNANFFTRVLLLAGLLLVSATHSAAQSAPAVSKVEPPSWWARHTINPVRVLLRGENLNGARVTCADASVRVVGAAKVNERGSYLFVDLRIAPSARPVDGERVADPGSREAQCSTTTRSMSE